MTGQNGSGQDASAGEGLAQAGDTPAGATLDGRTIGVIGLGLMGKPMALNLHTAGATVVAWNRSQAALDAVAAEGVAVADSPRAVAERCDTVIVMVVDTPAVDAMLHGDAGVLAGLDGKPEGTLVIDMGTTAVEATRGFAAEVADAGGLWLDAPVSGGQVGAEQAALTIMAGGSAAAFDRALPAFRAMGRQITHVGDVGAGQVAKAVNQMIVGMTIGAVSEALTLAEAAGVDPGKVREALRGGFAWSRILELHGQRMVDSTFQPGGRARVQLKDLRQALDLAESLEIQLPALELNATLYEALCDEGDADLDHSALIRHYRRARGVL
jgi:3-hydroxyisobutyrate dehydrogenase-like beta-hydroxyacid dehydrogenase